MAACPICVRAVWISDAAPLELVDVDIVKWVESILGHSSLVPRICMITLDCCKFSMRLGQYSTSPNFIPLKSKPTYFREGPAAICQECAMNHRLHTWYFTYILFCCSGSFVNRSSISPLIGKKPQLMLAK